jgi:hypothetical protein
MDEQSSVTEKGGTMRLGSSAARSGAVWRGVHTAVRRSRSDIATATSSATSSPPAQSRGQSCRASAWAASWWSHRAARPSLVSGGAVPSRAEVASASPIRCSSISCARRSSGATHGSVATTAPVPERRDCRWWRIPSCRFRRGATALVAFRVGSAAAETNGSDRGRTLRGGERRAGLRVAAHLKTACRARPAVRIRLLRQGRPLDARSFAKPRAGHWRSSSA